MARSKAYLFRGVEIRWRCDPALLEPGSAVPAEDSFHFPQGLADFLKALLDGRELVVDDPFTGEAALEQGARVEWAIAWPIDEETYTGWYCNTVPTPLGGTHETGLRNALLKGLRTHAERIGFKRANAVTAEDVMGGVCVLLSLFVRQPQFQGQTKERLVSPEATRLVENAIKDRFELWLGSHPATADGRARACGAPGRGADRAPQGQGGGRPQDRDPEAAPARQARRLRARRARRHRDLHRRGRFGRRLGQAGAQPRDPGHPAPARQDPQRRLGHRRQARRQQGAGRPGHRARLRRRQALAPATTCATTRS